MVLSNANEKVISAIDSMDPLERIAARRLRIQNRLKSATAAEELEQKQEVTEGINLSEKQMNESHLILTKHQVDGFNLVTNIRVADDARETTRRREVAEARGKRTERLEAETKSSTDKFEEITQKWESSLQKEIPQDLYEKLMQQKSLCDSMIEDKNKLITEFQMELKIKDDVYVQDLTKQAEDIDLLVERMDEQVKKLSTAYQEELSQIEKALIAERTELLEKQKNEWEKQMKLRQDKEVEFMNARLKRVEDHEQQLKLLREADAEDYKKTKIKLETAVQCMQKQLSHARAYQQLNQERLDYNFQVLRKRDEENTINKSQQKRKITRLQDQLTNIKSKLSKQEKGYKDDNQQLTEDYKRITEQFEELQKKSRHFITTDQNKFREVWLMNEEQAKQYAHDLMKKNEIIHDQILGETYKHPKLDFLNNVGPINPKERKVSKTAKQVAEEVLKLSEDVHEETSEKQQTNNVVLNKFSPKLIKSIFELLCDNTGFLMESKLNKLLIPLENDEQSLIRLDAIFSALGIENEDDIHKLSSYFISYDPIDEKTAETTNKKEKSIPQLVHANEVYKALHSFVENHHQSFRDGDKHQQFKLADISQRNDKEDAEYWKSYSSVLTDNDVLVWEALSEHLERYHEILLQRGDLLNKNDGIKQQNAELRMLLSQYVNSKINKDLEIPPTHLMNLGLQ